MATIQSTDLDFDNIKSNLKTYFQQQSEFADYDFEASGLSNILDVLAYNTHMNGLIANFALNESYMNTAQLRSSVVSHAELLGYFPRSQTSARATVNLSLNITDSERPSVVSLPAYTTFTSTIDNTSYTFQTLEEYDATDDGNGFYLFLDVNGSSDLVLVEGTLRTKTFIVGDTSDGQVYVIPDETIDTSTLTVNVYDTVTGSTFSTYTNLTKAIRVNSSSKLYQIKEVPNGYYEVIFGDGSVLGQEPKAGNKIVMTYLSTSSSSANGGKLFTPSEDVTVNSVDYPLGVTTVANSTGGDDKETIKSIKNNTSIAFASQQRMVTAQDYEAQILANYSSYIQNVTAWGGNENEPPIYGRTYVSIDFVDGMTDAQKQSIKDQIVTNLTKNLAVMSIDTVFVDPTSVYLELSTYFNFDPALTNITPRGAETQVKDKIKNYFDNSLKTFKQVFRRSSLLTEIDKISPAILNSRMTVKMQLRQSINVGTTADYNFYFPVAIANPSLTEATVISSRFTYEGQTCVIANRLGSSILEIQTLAGGVLVTNAGSYTASTGKVSLVSFNPTALNDTQLKISVNPLNDSTIRPLRSYIIDLDLNATTAQAQIDRQNTRTVLS